MEDKYTKDLNRIDYVNYKRLAYSMDISLTSRPNSPLVYTRLCIEFEDNKIFEISGNSSTYIYNKTIIDCQQFVKILLKYKK